jgi:hypothetical protein
MRKKAVYRYLQVHLSDKEFYTMEIEKDKKRITIKW